MKSLYTLIMGLMVSLFTLPVSGGYYYLDKIQVRQAWQITSGSSDIKVGILSTGANYKLDFLMDNIDVNTAEIPANGIDDDRNGYIDDVYGVNTHEGTGDPMDYIGVGTHSASLIGGAVNGILKKTSLVLTNPLSDQGTGSYTSVAKAIDYVVSRGARIVVIGLGGRGQEQSKPMCEAIETAKAQNVLFVAPAGNEAANLDELDEDKRIYPAQCGSDNILIVASSDDQDNLASYSSYGPHTVHVAAPGHNISGYNHLGREMTYSGSSFSTAITAAVVALALSANPTLPYAALKRVLMLSVDLIPDLSDKVISRGRINAFSAVRLARSVPR